MWREVRGGSVPQAVVGAAVAINAMAPDIGRALLEALGEDPAGELDRAAADGGLVLAESPRRAWWNGRLINVDWDARERTWALLDDFARQA